MNIIEIQKKNNNRLKRKLNKLIKNLSNLYDEEKINDTKIMEKIYFINQNMNNLENFIDTLNFEIQNNICFDQKLNDLIKKDQEAQEILDKFLPLMLYYQMIKSNS